MPTLDTLRLALLLDVGYYQALSLGYEAVFSGNLCPGMSAVHLLSAACMYK